MGWGVEMKWDGMGKGLLRRRDKALGKYGISVTKTHGVAVFHVCIHDGAASPSYTRVLR